MAQRTNVINFQLQLAIINMKKILAILILLPLLADANLNYNQAQLAQYAQTNQCPNCDLSGAALAYAGVWNHNGTILTNANLSGAATDQGNSFQNGDFSGAIMSSIILTGCKLLYANLTGAILVRADLSGANFSYANFTNAAIFGADLSRANLYHSNITPQQLASAASICNATLPDGTIGKCN